MAAYKVINLDSPIESDYWVDIPVRDPATNKDAVDEQGRILVQRHVTRSVKNEELSTIITAVETVNTLKEDYSTFKEEVSTKVNKHDSNILTNTNNITTLTDSVNNHDLQINALYTKINAIQGIDIDDFKYVTETDIKNIKENYLPLAGGNVTGNLTVQNKNVATKDFVETSINNLNTIRKNDGNDYYDDSDITSLIYAGNGAGTIRNEIANGDFSRVHPGQTIVGRVTGTTYIVVGCNIYKYRGDTELTQNHIGLMPIQLVGNAGNLLWSGRTYAGSGVNNTEQGYAPWASDNNTKGKNQTSCYRDSYIAKTVLPKVDNLWLKPDFENQGISVLTFRNLKATTFDANATCMSNPNWKGCATNWWASESDNGWTSTRLVLPSEPEIYGHYVWAGSPWESSSQQTQLPLYRHKEIHKVYPRVDIWLKDAASASYACRVGNNGYANTHGASCALRVCPLFLIA